PIGQIRLLVIIETPLAIVNLKEIAQADSRIDTLIFGAEDLIGEIGGMRTKNGNEVLFARSAVALYAAAFQLQAIDMVYIDFKDEAGLTSESQAGVELGYSGKQIIHPNQVSIVQKIFTPSDEQIAQAEKLIHEYNHYLQSGIGAYALDGKLIDAPVIKAAQNILNKARAAGKII
ncbi:MAG: HpcH/HpaI aldolase/citrate lyase family protein, partial [Anaerolineales bacterium]